MSLGTPANPKRAIRRNELTPICSVALISHKYQTPHFPSDFALLSMPLTSFADLDDIPGYEEDNSGVSLDFLSTSVHQIVLSGKIALRRIRTMDCPRLTTVSLQNMLNLAAVELLCNARLEIAHPCARWT
jgi:hypothetical protein